jgi:hypothetical protein
MKDVEIEDDAFKHISYHSIITNRKKQARYD